MDFEVVGIKYAHIADLAHGLIICRTHEIFPYWKIPIYTEGNQLAMGPFLPKTIKYFWVWEGLQIGKWFIF